MKIIWQLNSDNPDNGVNFNTISQWWSSLKDKEITFAQRLIPDSNNIDDLSWESQRFDEQFKILTPEVRGITLYWSKLTTKDQHNLTPRRLELDLDQEALYIYPQSQPTVVIRVNLPLVKYNVIELNNPQISSNSVGKNCLLVLRDKQEQLEVKVNLPPEKQLYLLSVLAKNLKLNAKLNLTPDTLTQLLDSLSNQV
jgi:hypothetical protein